MLLVASGSGGRRAHILRQADKRRETRGRRATSGEWTQSAYQGTGSDQRSRQPARPLRVLICAPSSALRHLRSVICASSCSICAGCSSPRAADNQCASRGTHTHTHARSDRCVRTHRPPPAAPCVHTRTPAGPRGGSLCRTRKGPLCTYSRRIATPWATRGQKLVCRNPTVYEPRRARGSNPVQRARRVRHAHRPTRPLEEPPEEGIAQGATTRSDSDPSLCPCRPLFLTPPGSLAGLEDAGHTEGTRRDSAPPTCQLPARSRRFPGLRCGGAARARGARRDVSGGVVQ